MTGPEHCRRAEELIAEAHDAPTLADQYAQKIAEAQVHATLALAAATGSDDGRRSRPGLYGWSALALAGLIAGASIFAYNWLNHLYPSVTLAASSGNLSVLQGLTLSAPRGSSVESAQQGVVQALMVTGPAQGTAEVTLPVPESQCHEMATVLNTSCTDGRELPIGNPVIFTWSKPQVVSSSSLLASAGLDVIPSLAQAGALRVTITATQASSPPSACFEAPYGGADLTVISGSRTFHYPDRSSSSWQATCSAGISDAGITVRVALGNGIQGNSMPPAFEFDGISTLAACASAPDGTVQGFAGQVNLDPGGTNIQGSPTTISLQADNPSPFIVSLDIGPNSQISAPPPCTPGQASESAACPAASSGSLAVCGGAATSVITSSGQHVPSEWARESAVWVPLLGGVVAAGVVAPLGVSVQALMDALKRLRWRSVGNLVKRLGGLFKKRAPKGHDEEQGEMSDAP